MSLEKLNAKDILDLLPDPHIFKITVLDSVSSTNDYLLESMQNADPATLNIVLAETQTAGKGRQDHVWNSPPGNIYLSLHKQFNCALKDLYGLSLVVGIAIARVLQANGLHDVKLKWPNDIYWQNRKLGGILIETKQNAGSVDVVIGIGLNVHDQTAPQFVCLEDALQHKVYRNKLVAQLLVALEAVMADFIVTGFDSFKDEWNNFAVANTSVLNDVSIL